VDNTIITTYDELRDEAIAQIARRAAELEERAATLRRLQSEMEEDGDTCPVDLLNYKNVYYYGDTELLSALKAIVRDWPHVADEEYWHG